MTAAEFTERGILGLYQGREDALEEEFPVTAGRKGRTVDWNRRSAAPELVKRAFDAGRFDKSRDVKSLGTWSMRIDGREVYVTHLSDGVYSEGRTLRPGKIGDTYFQADRRRLPFAECKASSGEISGLFESLNP
jgi:hypothetical protein